MQVGKYRLGIYVLILILIAISSIGCGPADETPTSPENDSTPVDQDQGYPPPRIVNTPVIAYPAPGETASGTLLALDKPISEGDTVVTGVGPPTLAVYLLNITFMGEQLGAAVIGEDGTFSIEVNPLPAGIRVGLTADVASSSLNPEDIRPGEDQISVPQVGYFYDSYVIFDG